MSLTKGSTKWVLFLSSSGSAEHRHIFDLAFGVNCLEKAGVSPADIVFYIDGGDRDFIGKIISNGTSHAYEIKKSEDFFSDLSKNIYENVVIFVTGHGSINGIDAVSPITPYALLQGLKFSPCLKQAIVYLGQCHAGIFNFMPVGRRIEGGDGPEIIFMGATNLHESLSAPTNENLLSGPVPWVANLFLLHVFKWISNPADVDGDGKKTIMDSYKYAGVMSNETNRGIKVTSFVSSMELHQRWAKAKEEHMNNPTNNTKLIFDAIEQEYAMELLIRYTHQECWILNAVPAQKIEI